MPVEHVPLLQIERDLHDIPRGMDRFEAYLKTMTNDARDDVKFVPMLVMNPMGREHVSERLDELLALNADTIAAAAVHEAVNRLSPFEAAWQHGLVVADDVRGGWTNRYTTDAGLRFSDINTSKRPRYWMTTVLWVSETPSPETVRAAVLETVYRVHRLIEHGSPRTLRQMLAQEGEAAAFAGKLPHLDADDLDYSRYVLEPLLDSADYGVCMAAMYGDEAARTLGYKPLGLSPYAGFAVGLANVIEKSSR